MRGRESTNLTSIGYINKLSRKYRESGNRLMLCGVEENILKQMKDGELIEAIGEENVIPIQPVIGGSIKLAYEIAERWIEENKSSLQN
jgi:hypothetical protein